MTPAKAVSIALQRVTPPRGHAKVAKATGISDSTLRRLRDDPSTVKSETIEALRLWPGFSAIFDSLMSANQPGADVLQVARRLSRSFPVEGLEAVAYQLEDLSEFLDWEMVAKLLKSQVEAHRAARPSDRQSGKIAISGE